jgi:hypothetical protein
MSQCPICHKDMCGSSMRLGKEFCNSHRIGKYLFIAYNDGVFFCFTEHFEKFLFETKSYEKMTEEYIEKMLLLT